MFTEGAFKQNVSENIIIERQAHTPPTLWIQGKSEHSIGDVTMSYPRQPHSAPPAFHYSPDVKRRRRVPSGAKPSEKVRS